MQPSYVPIERERLKGLYVDERLTMKQIAVRLACGATTIARRLRGFGIAARPTGPIPNDGGSTEPLAWTADIAYAVGLIATDGNLSRRKRQIAFTSKDRDQVETLRACLQLRAPIFQTRNGTGMLYNKVQWGDVRLYDWLMSIGLTPAKSLTLGPLAVPDAHFADFFRGCIDGDGSIVTYIDRYHESKNERYVYERLYVTLVSASQPFLDWIRATMNRLIGVTGAICMSRRSNRRAIYGLRYAKRESVLVLRWMYYAADVRCLARKREIAAVFLACRDSPRRRATGRPMVV